MEVCDECDIVHTERNCPLCDVKQDNEILAGYVDEFESYDKNLVEKLFQKIELLDPSFNRLIDTPLLQDERGLTCAGSIK